jgi:predicted O-linked N-acetylglucosamine transferase (SPINDLY family)
MPSASVAAPTPDAIQKAWESYARGERDQALLLCRSILAAHPEHAGALSLLGIAMAQSGRMQEAAELLGRAAARLPNEASAHNNYGSALRDVGRLSEALRCYDRALELAPGYAEAHYNRGVVLHDLKRFADALASYDRALTLKPDYAAAHNNRGGTLQELERYQDALTSYSRAIALKPDYVAAHNGRATAFLRIGRIERGLESAEKAISFRPDFAEAHNNRGIALQQLKRFDEAIASYDRAIALRPAYAEAHNNRGTAQRELGQLDEALASFDRALALKHDYAEAHNNRGGILRARRRFDEALASHDHAATLKPDFAEAHLNRGAVLHDLRRFDEALQSFQRALAANPQYVDAYRNQGLALRELGRPEEALASYERALELSPEDGFLQGVCRHVRMQICDWTERAADLERLSTAIDCGREVITPFATLSLFDSPRVQHKVASIWARAECRPARTLPSLRHYPKHSKIRVGYFSADFRNHAVSALAAELFECHSRSEFELTAFALGPDVRDELRGRVQKAFDRFILVFEKEDEEIAALARSLEIDIAVDLGGYTQLARPLIFAHRAAPIQVSYLGYLGTMGAGFMDYLLADEVIVPPGRRRFYAEKIAYLPSYQVNDSKRPVSDRAFTRAELGLPASGFVFCCFNASYKIAPETFHSWMRVLAAVPDGRLLVLGDNITTRQNLRREAVNCGIDPDRLVFSGRVAYGDYMARYRAADLFLDTHPYNAGTTASDALWMGLPVLTYAGEAFAARVAASILTAVGLPQLIASDRADYERLAIELANAPDRLQEIKRQLAAARGGAALFDTPRFARSLESLFRRMYERHHLGLLPEHLALGDPAK